MQNYDLVMTALMRWDDPLNSSAIAIARELALHHRVVYINRPYTPREIFKSRLNLPPGLSIQKILLGKAQIRKIEDAKRQLWVVEPGIGNSVNFLPDNRIYNWLSKFNVSQMQKALREAVSLLQMKEYIYLNSFLPVYFGFIPDDIPQPKLRIYRSSDDISQESYIARHGVRTEYEACQAADILLASSHELLRLIKEKANKPAYRIPNAVDMDRYQDHIFNISKGPQTRKVIIFTGKISDLRMDYELIKKMAQQFPEHLIRLVGPYNAEDPEIILLKQYENIEFTGAVKKEEVPSYLVQAELGIIPYKINKLTASIYPLKVNEYLAAGIPVLSTDFSEDIHRHSPHVRTALAHNHFLREAEVLLNQPKPRVEELRKLAFENSWESRISEFEKIISLHWGEK